MKPHPRIRKTIKWSGAAATVLLASTWFPSDRWWVNWDPPNGWHVEMADGHVRATILGVPTYPHPLGFYMQPAGTFDLRWVLASNGTGRVWDFPLWLPTGLCLTIAAAAWHLDAITNLRARLSNRCPKCHYDRTGLATGAVCPECGHSPPPSSPVPSLKAQVTSK